MTNPTLPSRDAAVMILARQRGGCPRMAVATAQRMPFIAVGLWLSRSYPNVWAKSAVIAGVISASVIAEIWWRGRR